jgi:hypothetical protein
LAGYALDGSHDPPPARSRKVNAAIDGSALNRDGSAHDALVDRLLELSDAGTVTLIVPKGVRAEILDPRTPSHKQEAAFPKIFSIAVGLGPEEQRRHRIIRQELQGNAKPGKHTADSDHLFEASKYGGYFITHDKRILKRAGALAAVLPPGLSTVTLAEFLAIYDEYETPSRVLDAVVQANFEVVPSSEKWTVPRRPEKACAVGSITIALRAMESLGRDLDWWEREHLVEAIGALFRGAYRLASFNAELALAPTNERSREATAKCGDSGRSSLPDLRSAFLVAAQEPLKRFPHFGPVVFAGDR